MAKIFNPTPKTTADQRRALTEQIRAFRSVDEFRAALTGEMLTYLGCTEKSSPHEIELGMVEMCRCYNQPLYQQLKK